MNPISDTAFLTCGARAADAAKAKPVCGDGYAARFLSEHAKRIFDSVKKDYRVLGGIVARHRIIDDLLRAKLAEDPNTSIVIIGAGFDTRAYRLPGGQWSEIDEPQLIEYKNRLLPVDQSPNFLQRTSIDFRHGNLKENLPTLASGAPVIVVMEGVFMYLSETQINETLHTLRQAFPGHTLLCDLNTRRFMEHYGKKLARRIGALGVTFKFMVDEPSLIFRQAGYQLKSTVSIVTNFLAYADATLTLFIVTTFLPRLAQGYAVYIFESPA
jgi:methyltransferase (TIGR00027 family)